jgi:methyl-accepting chemotaxis protein
MQTDVLHPQELGDLERAGSSREETVRPRSFQRRSFWIDRTSQLPITVLAVGACLFFVILFNATMLEITTARRQQIAGTSPHVEARMRQEDQALQRYLLVLSGTFLACMVVGIAVLTHRSAGPVHRIQSHLERLAEGELHHSVTLRQRDHFQGLAVSFNNLASSLRQRTAEDANDLEAMAAAAESCSTPAEVLAVAEKLRLLAQEKRRAIGSHAES